MILELFCQGMLWCSGNRVGCASQGRVVKTVLEWSQNITHSLASSRSPFYNYKMRTEQYSESFLFVSLHDHGYKSLICIPSSHIQTQQPTTILRTNLRQNKPLRIVIILQCVSEVNQRAGPAGTEQIARIAVRMDLARERLERLVRETRKHPTEVGRPLLERLDPDVAGIAHQDDGSDCGERHR